MSFPGASVVKNPAAMQEMQECAFDPSVVKIPWRTKRLPTPVFVSRESPGQRSLVGYSPWVAQSRTLLSHRALVGM